MRGRGITSIGVNIRHGDDGRRSDGVSMKEDHGDV